MPGKRRSIALGCVLATTFAAGPRPGAWTAAGPSGSAPVVRVNAVVTDSRGELLAGLQASDFELTVDGQPHALDTAQVSQEPTRRAFGFLLDEFHTAPADSAAIRASVLRFIDERLRPEDVAFVVKPLDPLTIIRPTADRAVLREAVSSFEGRKGDYTPRTVFERNYMAQAPAAVEWARGQIVTSALRAIGAALSQAADVRSAIVLVSDGFERMRTGRDVPANLQTAVRVANRADAPVYALAPALSPPPPGATGAPDPAFAALHALATQTGGELVTGPRAVETGLARMTRDLERHYVLTYRAPHGSDGRFHELQLAVKRPGVQVRARTGYVAPVSAEALAASKPLSSAPIRVLRRSPLIRSWAGIAPAAGGRASVTITWEPSAALAVTPQPSRAAAVVVSASAPDGTVLFDATIAPVDGTSSAEVPNRAEFEAPRGSIRVDMKILDAKGVVLDTDARDINVPVTRGNEPTIYPPAVMRTRSAREFRDAVDGRVPPVAAREFRRTDRLLVRVPAADSSGVPLAAAAVLLNRWRQPMRAVTALAPSPDAAREPSLFDLPLAALAPGEYTLRVSVTHAGRTVAEHVTFRVTG